MVSEETAAVNGEADKAPSPPEAAAGETAGEKAKRVGMKLSYEEYKQMANLMVYFMRQKEEGSQDGE